MDTEERHMEKCRKCGKKLLAGDTVPAVEKIALAGEEPPKWSPGLRVSLCEQCAKALREEN